ncbi:MAG: hypothetical protein B5M56_00175 [Desulfococcus sp. 4484_241]|nr:MAG: hypothetical protein B5M56_00175 [Desulfococcus sp. 4484_241]
MKKILAIVSLIFVAGHVGSAFGQDAAGAWLKSSYLQSIHDDCLMFLEGIELFIQRDYPVFVKNVRNGHTVNRSDVATYIGELKHFEKLLDSLYEEYITFKNASIAETGKATGAQGRVQGLTEVEQRLYQMLAYSYLQTGDFAMARMLIMNHDVLSRDFTIKIRDIEGNLVDFPLTKRLKEQFKTENSVFSTITIHFKNFFSADIPEDLNVYIKVAGYDKTEPFNMMYMEFYKKFFPGINNDKSMIHVGQIVKFFNIEKYRYGLLSGTIPADKAGYETTCSFPIVKGTYQLVVKDPTVSASLDRDDEITIERLCLFKGLARTDFRSLKEEQHRQQKGSMSLDQDLTLLSRGKDYISYKPGQMVPYGVYYLFQKDQELGAIELVPCHRGGSCKPPSSKEPGVTTVRVFDHTFVLSRDILDLVKKNNETRIASEIRKQEVKRRQELGLFPGCSPTAPSAQYSRP